MHRYRCGFSVLALVALSASWLPAAEAPKPATAAEIVPSTALAYAELSRPQQLIGLILDHPLTKRILEIPEVKKGMETDKYREFQNGVALVEDKIGQKWRPAMETVLGGGVYLVGDMATQGGAVLIKSQDEALLKKLIDALLELGRAAAANDGKGDPFELVEYRGVQAYKAGEGYFAIVGPWYVVTNKAELGRNIIDLYLDRKDPGLAGDSEFQAARKVALGESPRSSDIGWGYLRLTPLRAFGLLAKLSEKSPNPGAELIAGGVLSTLERAPYITTTLSADASELKLAFATPHDESWTPDTRKFFFGSGGGSTAPLKAPETLLSVVTHRDLGALWLAASDLFSEEVAAEMAKADSGLSLFFSGKNFGKEVLGGLGPNWQLLLARPKFVSGAGPVPAIKLPTSALVFELKDVEKTRTQFKVAFQSTLGFLNILSAQAGNPQMELETEKLTDGVLLSANFLLEPEMKQQTDAKIHFNFSPALALVGNRAILASSRQLASDLAAEVSKASKNARIVENTLMELDLKVGKQLVVDNLNQLIAQNILEKGHTQAEAEKEIGGLVELMSWLEQSWMKLTAENKTLRLELGLKLKK